MNTVVETPTFVKLADEIWTESERMEFVACHPSTGRRPDSRCRRRPESAPGAGRQRQARRGPRHLFQSLVGRLIYLLAIYRKADQSTIDPADLPGYDT